MTNETTASQPTDFRKILVAVRESLQFANDTPNGGINDTLWMMHGPAPETVFDFIDAALEGEPSTPQQTKDLFASQPKSIGDDALWARTEDIRIRFSNPTSITRSMLLHYAECLLAHLAILRAPAAQASVTIQAAPNMSKLDRYEEYGNESGGGLQEAPDGDFVRLSDVEALIAATIKEPVMVAEPVGASQTITINGRQLQDALDAAWPDREDVEQGDTELTMTSTENNVAAQAGDEPMRAAFEAAKDGLELYAESYDLMSRMGDGKVHCTSVAFDIRRNMVDAVAKALSTPRATADVEQEEMRERVARAIWNLRREEEDRCDMELEDMGDNHSVWAEADAAILATTKPGA